MPSLPAAMTAPTRLSLPWPLPALLAWALAWASYLGVHQLAQSPGLAWLVAALLGGALGWRQAQRWRQFIVAGGFPLSSLMTGATADVPPWLWLLPLAMLALAYPARSWRDAPWFPTPLKALQGLNTLLPLPAHARVLDAGCGLGHGLRALHQQWPQARLEGVEWSGLLRLGAALACPWAKVRGGDMWADDWSAYDVVYLFQRPESMPRALAKAQAEMRPGSWLLSLAFEAPGLKPTQVLRQVDGREVWLYRMKGASECVRAAQVA